MRDRGVVELGIRGKLNLGVGLVVLGSALVFGSAYALGERATILGEKHEHLAHVASLARLSFEGTSAETLPDRIAEFGQHLSEATGTPHDIRIVDSAGRTLVASEPRPSGAGVPASEIGLWTSLFPSSMLGEIPIRVGSAARPARLIVEESLEGVPSDLGAAFLRHVAFAVVLFGLTAVSTSLLVHFLIVRPVRELAAATERFGTSGVWEPYSPTVRRRDEVGVLCDRFAELSRRLLSAVRDERYGSAHLVALGVERGLDEPVQRAKLELALLQAELPAGSEQLERCAELGGCIDEIVEVCQRLKSVGGHPVSSEA